VQLLAALMSPRENAEFRRMCAGTLHKTGTEAERKRKKIPRQGDKNLAENARVDPLFASFQRSLCAEGHLRDRSYLVQRPGRRESDECDSKSDTLEGGAHKIYGLHTTRDQTIRTYMYNARWQQ
jgi:hypothetical protein